MVEKACIQKDEQNMKAGIVGMTKLESLLKAGYKTKDYMGLQRTQLLEGIKGNHENMFIDNDLKCGGCSLELDTQCHVLSCEAYRDLREEKVIMG